MSQSSEVKDLFAALSKVQRDLRGALKDSKNPFFNSKYADLESVWESCRSLLAENGLCVIQTTEYEADVGACVVTTLGHTSGQWIRGTLPIVAAKKDPQGMGSAITYARRYALAAIVGIVQVDDDGESAMDRRPIAPQQPTADDGNTEPPSYRIPFGKWAQRSLEEVYKTHGDKPIIDYIQYLEDSAKKKGAAITGQVKEFIDRADAFLGAMEREFARAEGSRV